MKLKIILLKIINEEKDRIIVQLHKAYNFSRSINIVERYYFITLLIIVLFLLPQILLLLLLRVRIDEWLISQIIVNNWNPASST